MTWWKKTKKQSSKDTKKLSKKQQENGSQSEDSDVPVYQLDIKPSFWDIISPDGISIGTEDHGMIKQSLSSTTLFRPMYIPRAGYPRKMQTNWISALTNTGEIDVIVDVHKIKKTDAIQSLQKQQTMLQSNLGWQLRRGNLDQINDLRTKIGDTEVLMDEIQFSENDMYNVSTMCCLYGSSEKEIERYTDHLNDEMSSKFFTLATTFKRVKKGLLSCLPLGINKIEDSLRNMDRRALSTFSPFISGSGRYLGGVPLGVNKITGHKEFINSFGNDDFRPQNYNMGIFGIPGSGKSLAMKLKIAREMAGANVYARIIDPEGEFVKLTTRLGGITLNINEESDVVINPCALNYSDIPLDDMDDEELEALQEDDSKEIIERDGKKYLRFVPIREKVNELLDFFDIIVRGKDDSGLDVFERNYLEEAIMAIFNELGINTHPSSLLQQGVQEIDGRLIQSSVRKPEPEIKQIYDYIVEKYQNEFKAERIIAAIRPFLRDGSKPIFDGQTYLGRGVTQSIETSRLVNFNISQMEEGFLRPIAYHVLINYLWEHFAKNINNATKKKFIYADELWQFVDYDMTISFFEKVARRIRKRHGGLIYASQDFVRLLENTKARGILTSTFTLFFMQQNKIDLSKIKDHFDLTDGEIDILFNNPNKGEGILRSGKSSVWLQTDPSDEELTFIESNQAVLEEMLRHKKLKERKEK